MTTNEIVGRLKAGGLEASSTNRGAAVYVTDATGQRATPGWFGFRIICDSEATERRVRSNLSRFYYIEANGNVWRLKSRNLVPLMAIKRGGVPPTPPTPSGKILYFEAAQANSTVLLMSTLPTAPSLEYSTDGETWQEWQHNDVEMDGITGHVFDTLTLGTVGDRVYLRGNNPNGLCQSGTEISKLIMTGQLAAGGNIMSLLDKTMALTEIPNYGLYMLFGNAQGPVNSLVSPPSMNTVTKIGTAGCSGLFYNCTDITSTAEMSAIENVGNDGCHNMYANCTSLDAGFGMPSLEYMGGYAFTDMYVGCTFDMSDDGTTLNFAFPTPPITAGDSYTYATAYDVANWMGNTNGFTTP